jgi:CRISPR-associated endoribonuclease Cas6
MARPKRTKKDAAPSDLSWSADTELVGLVFELTPRAADYLYPQYTTKLHAWFLDQVRQTNPDYLPISMTVNPRNRLPSLA